MASLGTRAWSLNRDRAAPQATPRMRILDESATDSMFRRVMCMVPPMGLMTVVSVVDAVLRHPAPILSPLISALISGVDMLAVSALTDTVSRESTLLVSLTNPLLVPNRNSARCTVASSESGCDAWKSRRVREPLSRARWKVRGVRSLSRRLKPVFPSDASRQ